MEKQSTMPAKERGDNLNTYKKENLFGWEVLSVNRMF
jgi:hypothetical protein